MRKHAIVLGLSLLGLCAFAFLAGWATFNDSRLGGGGRSLGPMLPYLLVFGLLVAALAGFLVWLAFYSANQGYDDRIDPEGH